MTNINKIDIISIIDINIIDNMEKSIPMAEFCYECYKKILRGEKSERQLVITKHLELCEGCGTMKQIIIKEKFSFFDLFTIDRY